MALIKSNTKGIKQKPYEHTINVWFMLFDSVDSNEIDACRKWLSETERSREAQFAFDRDRFNFVLGRALLRAALSHRYPERGPEEWCFINNKLGRPTLPDGQCSFNVAHAQGAIICAVGHGVDLGIDVEHIRDNNVWDEIIPHIYSETEHRLLRGLWPKERSEYACFLWALKEAYVKARGVGLTLPLNQLSFKILDEGIEFKPSDSIEADAAKWSFQAIEVSPAYRAAVCWSDSSIIMAQQITGPSTLLNLNRFVCNDIKTINSSNDIQQ